MKMTIEYTILLCKKIERLRKEMEEIYLSEHSLTALNVIALSKELDHHLNEYMILMSKENNET